MPPKARITKDMILHTVLDITRETGFGTVNARSIAARLQCSTRPIFTCYENMDELKAGFLEYAYGYYEQYVTGYGNSVKVSPYLLLPLSYIEFAREETHLFKLLFINDMDLDMSEAKDFYKEAGNEKKAALFSKAIGVEPERAKVIYLDLFLYTHGMAVLTATKKLALSRTSAETMLTNFLSAFIKPENPDWNPSI
ncbi:TetR/AcrR family transcriptional regulator [Enterocloster sp. OA13]|uniref:TetR/AcrR family transcriptional regulator n=1 Tax=Enterocloster hominis (ex Hitch et al. 2024) TaxID=1917870 RepID=A0ABV1D939_9FIRM|nr:TetR/AcrR family transcriptional regulator [Lachnoclostridium pacaense]EEQ58183.1 hypothetical protein CBFG_01893 [Clostridiales bacterium 1_7_47FAA]MCH1951233.1 TetR/AcrR family transcriptional regulator [Enterocloster sp. OA13]RJW54357.1 TetR/AcrR family transcriptional regulator [Clostridiales bacterium TF09-2AC]MCC2816983.1 TetR/AcrR family transcriptional regulator [Lachnoclostridium pacaense]MCC2878916.1 TetR/AcrR family transcriptional regulator [Lachnoclostridium pacaense]